MKETNTVNDQAARSVNDRTLPFGCKAQTKSGDHLSYDIQSLLRCELWVDILPVNRLDSNLQLTHLGFVHLRNKRSEAEMAAANMFLPRAGVACTLKSRVQGIWAGPSWQLNVVLQGNACRSWACLATLNDSNRQVLQIGRGWKVDSTHKSDIIVQ